MTLLVAGYGIQTIMSNSIQEGVRMKTEVIKIKADGSIEATDGSATLKKGDSIGVIIKSDNSLMNITLKKDGQE